MEIIFTIAMITRAFCYYQNNKISITNLKVKGKVKNSTKSKLVVSRGLGNSGFSLRLFNRPDLVVIDIIVIRE